MPSQQVTTSAMNVDKVFLSINAKDFAGLSDWWKTFLGRHWDREPVPSCHEWDLAGCVLFQVLDNPEKTGMTTVSLHVADLDSEIVRLREAGIDVAEPVKVDGFDDLLFSEFEDPEGNTVGLLEGS